MLMGGGGAWCPIPWDVLGKPSVPLPLPWAGPPCWLERLPASTLEQNATIPVSTGAWVGFLAPWQKGLQAKNRDLKCMRPLWGVF